MAWRATGPGRTDRGLGQDPPEGPFGDLEFLALGEQLGEVGVVDPGIGRRRELDDPPAHVVADPVPRSPSVVAVDEARGVGGSIPAEQAADLADRECQDPRRLLGREPSRQDVVEDVQAMLRFGVQGDRLPRFHTLEGDKVTGRLAGDTFTGRPHSDIGGLSEDSDSDR